MAETAPAPISILPPLPPLRARPRQIALAPASEHARLAMEPVPPVAMAASDMPEAIVTDEMRQ